MKQIPLITAWVTGNELPPKRTRPRKAPKELPDACKTCSLCNACPAEEVKRLIKAIPKPQKDKL